MWIGDSCSWLLSNLLFGVGADGNSNKGNFSRIVIPQNGCGAIVDASHLLHNNVVEDILQFLSAFVFVVLIVAVVLPFHVVVVVAVVVVAIFL